MHQITIGVAVVPMLLTSGLGCAGDPATDTLAVGLEYYRANRLEDALPLFERSKDDMPQSADAHAWHAETARRLNRFDEAQESARNASAIEPCNSFAHTVLAAVYHPALSDWSFANADSSWTHALAAVECDPSDGNARIAVWAEALRRGERDIEDEALRSLLATEFIPRAVVQFNRWVLRSLPDSAVLITDGDWDTYPALALQVAEGFRQDVAVVNANMLNLEWYADTMNRRHGVPIPPGTWSVSRRPADHIIGSWRAVSANGEFNRPVVFALTVSPADIPEGAGVLRHAGAYQRLMPVAFASPDTAAMRVSFEDLSASDFMGATTSPNDRSAVRIASNPRFPNLIVYAATMYAQALAEDGRVAEALEAVQWAERFATEAGVAEEVRESTNHVRESIDELM